METTKNFVEYQLDPSLINSLEQMGFNKTTPVQDMTMTPILNGDDIFAQAETGSGKTGSFVIPLVEKLLRNDELKELVKLQANFIVLSPTRELAQQTHKVVSTIGNKLNITSACLIGGENIEKQKKLLQTGVHFLVATPGRLCDLVKQKAVNIKNCSVVVFDEADRLFDMGFQKDIEYILRGVNKQRQLVMVSATCNMDVLKTAYKHGSHPKEIKLNEDSLVVDHIDHKLAMLSSHEKMPLLVNILRQKEDAYTIVFCNTQFQTHLVAEWLKQMKFKAKPISGRLAQNKRTRLMEEFRSKQVTTLVCTDVAARGLDIKDVNLVINYDLPQEAANYVHRIGRTGRAGKDGEAISFCAHEDSEYLDGIYSVIESKIPKMRLEDEDFATDLCVKPYIDGKTLRLTDRKTKDDQFHKLKANKETMKNKNRPKRTENRRNPNLNNKQKNNETEKTGKTMERNNNQITPLIRHKEIVAYTFEEARTKALSEFDISDESLLEHEILKEGKKKFILFGPRQTQYKFQLKAHYRKLLLPFLIKVIGLAKLKLYVKVGYSRGTVNISFNGDDIGLLRRNRFELLNAFENISKTYLNRRISLPRDLRIKAKCFSTEDKDAELIKRVDKVRQQVIESLESALLPALNPAERRIVHNHLSSDTKVKTTSIGDGKFKKIEISLK